MYKSQFIINRTMLHSLEDNVGISYSNVSSRRWMWNSKGGWKKYQKLIVGALVFSFSPSGNFSSFEYLCFLFLLPFPFILIWCTRVKKTEKNFITNKIEKFQLCFTLCFDIKDNMWRKVLGEILKRLLLLSRLKDVLAGTFSEI